MLAGCNDNAARAKNDAKLSEAIRKTMCTNNHGERARALSRVVELAVIADPEETRQSTVVDIASGIDCTVPISAQ